MLFLIESIKCLKGGFADFEVILKPSKRCTLLNNLPYIIREQCTGLRVSPKCTILGSFMPEINRFSELPVTMCGFFSRFWKPHEYFNFSDSLRNQRLLALRSFQYFWEMLCKTNLLL